MTLPFEIINIIFNYFLDYQDHYMAQYADFRTGHSTFRLVNKQLYQYINDNNEFDEYIYFLEDGINLMKFGSCIKLGAEFGIYDSNRVSVGDNISKLTNLTYINLPASNSLFFIRDDDVTNHGISRLTNLKILCCNDHISDNGLKLLTNLTSLDINDNIGITDNGIKHLTKLNFLNIPDYYNMCTSQITNYGISGLTNLKELVVRNNEYITYEGLTNLVNLESLEWNFISTNTDNLMIHLTNLTRLRDI